MKMDKYILDIGKMTEVEKENYKKIIKRNVIKPLFKILVFYSTYFLYDITIIYHLIICISPFMEMIFIISSLIS